jgi:FkbM family methyltransferase
MDYGAAERRLNRLFDIYGQRYSGHLIDTERERVAFASGIYIFGAGQNGKLIANVLRAAGITPTAFIDDTPSKIGTRIDDLLVIETDTLRNRPRALVIVSVFLAHYDYLAIAQRLRTLGANTMSVFQFYWSFASDELPFYFLDMPALLMRERQHIMWLAEHLLDDASVDELCAHIEFRLSLRHDILPAWTAQRLAPPQHWQRIGFIDAGAFDGDTVIPFVTLYGDRTAFAIALEPDPTNYAALLRNIERLSVPLKALVEPLDSAMDDLTGTAGFSGQANAGSQLSSHGGTMVRTTSLDDLLEGRQAEKIYLKIDVEGAEASVLRGAAKTIRTSDPFLAVSVYHRPSDLWELPLQISELNGRYRFMLRSHGADGADLTAYAVAPGDLPG